MAAAAAAADGSEALQSSPTNENPIMATRCLIQHLQQANAAATADALAGMDLTLSQAAEGVSDEVPASGAIPPLGALLPNKLA